MSSRKDLERRIARSLEHITADDMQRLAEDYARIRFPQRFPRFDFRALSPQGRSRPGWPDAYVNLPDGCVDGVEATIQNCRDKVRHHLRGDLAKARDRSPKLSGLIFVSGQPAVQLSDDELNKWRGRFADEAGLDLERIDLVFGGQLIQDLARPEFARTRIEILGLADLPAWFELVRPPAPSRNPDADFIPSREDFERGWVHRPRQADLVHRHLEKDGRVLVRGVGASGKTVLAWSLALDATKGGWPAYYLDLANLGDSTATTAPGIVDDFLRFGHPEILFILDNIHINERLAAQLAAAWEELGAPQRPRLLLLERELRTGRGSPIAGIDIRIVPLMARQEDVLGVYRRLIRRKTGAAYAPEPPPDVLDRWVATFGGDPTSSDTTTDLIAFSAAVLNRLDALVAGDWILTEGDAVDEIREAYLKRLGRGETHNLMRLAMLAEVELPLPEKVLVDGRAGFDVAARTLGLVFREQDNEFGRTVRYRLAHQALGRLLLTAAFDPIDPVQERRIVALTDPLLAVALPRRLEAVGEVEEAHALLVALMQEPARLLDRRSLADAHALLSMVERASAVPLNTIANALLEPGNRERLIDSALNTHLSGLQAFLAYAERMDELRPVFDFVAAELRRDQHRGHIAQRALRTPLGALQAFLVYAEGSDSLRLVADDIITELSADARRTDLIARAIDAPLGALQAFLDYAGRHAGLAHLYAALLDELASEARRHDLVARAVLMPPTEVPRFLRYADKIPTLRSLATAVITDLSKDDNRSQLVGRAKQINLGALQSLISYAQQTNGLRPLFDELCTQLEEDPDGTVGRALRTPLLGLQSFLVYAAAADRLKNVFKVVVAALAENDQRKQLVDRLTVEPIASVVALLRSSATHELWKRVCLDVDENEWTRRRLRESAATVDAFVTFQHCAAELGRADLAAAPALNLIRACNRKRWHQPAIGLRHMSHVIRCATRATANELGRFLSEIGTGDWIDQEISSRSPGRLAGSLLALSTSLSPDLRSVILRSSVRERVLTELTITAREEVDAWGPILALLGAATALGLELDSVEADWPRDEDLTAILDLQAPASGHTTLHPRQVQLWLGLREMARLRLDSVSVPEKHGDAILSLWRSAHDGAAGKSLPVYVRTANIAMLEWLERCRSSGWRLVRSQPPARWSG